MPRTWSWWAWNRFRRQEKSPLAWHSQTVSDQQTSTQTPKRTLPRGLVLALPRGLVLALPRGLVLALPRGLVLALPSRLSQVRILQTHHPTRQLLHRRHLISRHPCYWMIGKKGQPFACPPEAGHQHAPHLSTGNLDRQASIALH